MSEPVNRNPIKQWAITFSQVRDVTDKLKFAEEFPPAVYSICCEEEHADGGLHLHMGVKLKKGISKANLLKWIKARFPDDYKRIKIQVVRNWDDWMDYLKKEDPDTIIKGSIEISKGKRRP